MKYHLARGDQQLGTFNDLDVSAGLRDGRFQPGDLCWTEGMSGWKRLDEHLKEISPDPEPSGGSLDLDALRDEVRRDQLHTSEQLPLASIGRRFAAFAIDWALVLLPMMTMLMSLMDGQFEKDILANQDEPTAIVELLQQQIEKQAAANNEVLPLMSLLIMALMLLNTILLTVRGQTVGKWLAGIRVVRFADGSRAGFFKAVLLRGVLFIMLGNLRFIGPVLFLADYWLAFREERRCLHDIVADTKVVRSRA